MGTDQLKGRVAFVTGSARGLGRSHAVALARLGVDVTLFDICHQVTTAPYPLATAGDLAETAEMVRDAGARALSVSGDVRSLAALEAAVERTIAEFGGLDFLVANAGIWSFGGNTHEISELQWDEMIAVNLTGTWHSVRAVLPHMESQAFGRIVATSAMTVRGGATHLAHYNAAAAGVVSLVKSVAIEFAHKGITCNAVLPTSVSTGMAQNELMHQLMSVDGFAGPIEEVPSQAASEEQAASGYQAMMAMPIPWVEPEDVSAAITYLLSDASRFTTGIELPVNGGYHRGMG